MLDGQSTRQEKIGAAEEFRKQNELDGVVVIHSRKGTIREYLTIVRTLDASTQRKWETQ
jgi:hypothetical protein